MSEGMPYDEQMQDWANTYDPTAYMPFVTKPILFVSGMTDSALINGNVYFEYSADLDHGHYFDLTPGVEIFFGHVLFGKELPCAFLSASARIGEISVTVDKEIKIAKLFTTKSTKRDSHVWSWESEDIVLSAGENQITLPEGTVAALVSAYLSENDQAVYSTDLFVLAELSRLS